MPTENEIQRHIIQQLFKTSEELLKNLYDDDFFYRTARFALIQPKDAKKIVLYGLVREVRKACCILLEKRELLEDETTSATEADDPIGRQVFEAIHDELQLWVRKLTEALVTLINFQNLSQDDREYRIYLTAENLDLFLGRQSDQDAFFGTKNHNVEESIKEFRERIEEDMRAVNSGQLWFLEPKKDPQTISSPSLFKSFRSCYRDALTFADTEETLLLGTTYQNGYSHSSESVHTSAGAPNHEPDFDSLRASASHIFLLGLHIIDRANAINGTTASFSIKNRMAGKSVAPDLIQKFKKDFEVGDLVLVQDKPAEITQEHRSKYGYTSYDVRFLDTPPIHSISTDCYPSNEIQVLVKKKKIREFVTRSLKQVQISTNDPDILSQDDEFLFESTKSMFVELSKYGVLIPMLTQKAGKTTSNPT